MTSLSSSIYNMLLHHWNAMTYFGRVQIEYTISVHLLFENKTTVLLLIEQVLFVSYYNTDISLF